MVNYPNALQPPPSGIKLPDQFLGLTQPTGNASKSKTQTSGTNSSTSNYKNNSTGIDVTNSTVVTPATNSSSSSTTEIWFIDPHFNSSSSNTSLPTNVGQHVLNGNGEVDGSDIGLGKNNPNGTTSGSRSENHGLSTGTTAAVVLGSLVGFIALVMVMAIVMRKMRKSAREKKGNSVFFSDRASSSFQYHM